MSATLRSLCEEYHVSISDGIHALQKQGILVLSIDVDIPTFKESTYRKVLSSISPPKPRANIPQPPNPVLQKPRPRPKAYPGVGSTDPDQRQREILSRDYLILTYMALRKPQTADILYQVLQLKVTRHTSTQIVLCKAAADALQNDAKKFPVLETIASRVKQMAEHHALCLLPGALACENQILSRFIQKQDISASILVLGQNRSLHMAIEHRNELNKKNPAYHLIYERDIDSKARLVNPARQRPVFPDPQGKAKAPYPETPALVPEDIPGEGDTAYVLKGREDTGSYEPVRLGKPLGLGGESKVYQLPDGKCTKVFKSKANSTMKKEKVTRMIRKLGALRAVDATLLSRLAWPEKMLFNAKHQWVGYVMPLFSDTHPFSHFNYATFTELIPDVSKANQIQMALSLTELVDFLHFNNILLCDINTSNILFDDKQNSYLIDLDSAQVAFDDQLFPTNVGTPDFLSPEHIRSRTFAFVRNKADDVWILQNLLFQILTPCGNPYSSSIYREDERDYVEKGMYPFQFANHPAEEALRATPWYNVVSHFPFYVKEAFWESFNGQGKWFHEQDRQPASYWLNILVRYQQDLPGLASYDPESGKYMPSRAKKAPPPKASVISEKNERMFDDFNNFLTQLSVDSVNKNNKNSRNNTKNKSWESIV